VLELLNTQAASPEKSSKMRLKKYAKGSDAWKNIKISKRGMRAGMDFISNYNISEFIRTNPYLKDPNTTGRKLNQNFPEEFRDLLADITYRFGGGAFTNSKSLKTRDRKSLPFEKVLKSIVTAKDSSERSAALQKFKDLFMQTKIYHAEKNTARIRDAIKSIDKLTTMAIQDRSWS